MKNKITIIKIGGNIIDNVKQLDTFLVDFAKIQNAKILIHGGGKIASDLNKRLGIETIMNDGRRITSTENLDTVTMVYAGLINKRIVAKLQSNSCNALGLSGSDANCILAEKRPSTPIDFGWVGDVKYVNIATIEFFLTNKITPVFCAIGHDGDGQLLNTNADTVAAEIAIAMSEDYDTELIYCFEKNGVMMNMNDSSSVIQHIDSKMYSQLLEQKIINEGMLPKMKNCFHALQNKVAKVVLGNAAVINSNNEEPCTTLTL